MEDFFKLISTGECTALLDRFAPLVLDKARLLKSNEYYQSIHPTEAAETDARLEADRKKKEAAAAAKAAKAKPAEGAAG